MVLWGQIGTGALTSGAWRADDTTINDWRVSTVPHQRSSSAVVADPCVALGRFAELLSEGASLPSVLDALTAGLGVRTAVLRSAAGELLAVGGEALHAVPLMRAVPAEDVSVEVPVRGGAAALTVLGARPSHLPALRAAAAVLSLVLTPHPTGSELLDAAEDEHDEMADALHDGPVQTLVVARYAADAAVRGGDPVEARDAVQAALVQMRRTLWELRPRGGSGLLAALDQLAAHLDAAVTTRATTDLTGAPAVLAYRLVQAVAGATPVRVHVHTEDGAVVVDIDGGVPLSAPERWVHRARALGGSLSSSAGRLRLAFAPSRTTDARTAP